MIFTSENNWYYWYYGDQPPFSRQSGNLEFRTHFGKQNKPIKDFKSELLNAAESVLGFSSKPDLFFSGGVDSELMLRAFQNLKANFNVIIVRYENDYNLYDVSYAVTICSLLNISYKIIDFNLKKFYENECITVSELAQIDRPRALPYCKFLELSDNLPILAGSDLYTFRTNDNYSVKGTWQSFCSEWDTGWSRYAHAINRQAIPEWLKWTPGLVVSYMNLGWYKKLINDEYYGKLGVNSTKIIGYREAFPNLLERKKQTGFEKIDTLIDEVENFIQKKYNGLPYRNTHIRNLNEIHQSITDTILY